MEILYHIKTQTFNSHQLYNVKIKFKNIKVYKNKRVYKKQMSATYIEQYVWNELEHSLKFNELKWLECKYNELRDCIVHKRLLISFRN